VKYKFNVVIEVEADNKEEAEIRLWRAVRGDASGKSISISLVKSLKAISKRRAQGRTEK
jgi:hypothetical protein